MLVIHYLISIDLDYIFLSLLKYFLQNFSTKKIINLLSQKDQEKTKPLHIAAYRGLLKVVQEVLKYDKDIMESNGEGYNVLHFAAKGNSASIFIFFLEKYHMNITSRDNTGNTPLHIACSSGSLNVVSFILMKMNNINQQNYKGDTALHLSLVSERTEIIKKLLKKGIDFTIKNNDGLTAGDVAMKTNYLKHLYSLINSFKRIDNINVDSALIYNPNTFVFLFICIEICSFILLLVDQENYNKNKVLFLIVNGIILLLFFVKISSSDPGILISDKLKEDWLTIIENDVNINDLCPYCKTVKEATIKHCHLCGHCIKNFDHHCNWIGKCIGENNKQFFFFFLVDVIFNLIINYWIGLRVYKNIDGNTYSKFTCVILMTSCLVFIMPVGYLLYIQIKNKSSHKK